LSQGTRIRCNVDGIRCVMVAADRPWPHQNAKPTGQEALDAAAQCVVAWSRPGAPCCRTRRSGHGAAGSGRGSSPCDHAASAVASPTPRRGEEGCGGKEGEHGKGLAAAVLAAARTPGSTLERRRGLRSGWRRGFGGGAGESLLRFILVLSSATFCAASSPFRDLEQKFRERGTPLRSTFSVTVGQ